MTGFYYKIDKSQTSVSLCKDVVFLRDPCLEKVNPVENNKTMAHPLDNIRDRVVYPASHDLSFILPDNWYQNEDNPNTFFSDRTQCICVYDGYIQYWEDYRTGDFIKVDLPIGSQGIDDLINGRFKSDVKS